ncbi:MAG: hypothetical protein ACFWUC_08855 [Oscillospiraceae bacterium]|jgi:beta-galactosidase
MQQRCKNEQSKLQWLTDPHIYEVNRVPAHSDHLFYPGDSTAHISQSLNGTWFFSVFPSPYKVDWNFLSEKFAESANQIKVPGHIQLQGFAKPQYVNTMYPWDGKESVRPPQVPMQENLTGCYARSFELEQDWEGKNLHICFEGAESCLYVWLNGKFIGYSEDSFTPSEFDLTKAAHTGKNWLSVMVVRFCSGSWLEDQDFWRFSGIFRDVRLFTVPWLHVEDLDVRSELSDDFSSAELRVRAAIHHPEGVSFRVGISILDTQSQQACDPIDMVVSGDVDLSFTVDHPKLWSAEKPNLYQLRMTLFTMEKIPVETSVTQIGFRRFELKNGIMLLNGKRIVFRGINRHEFSCDRGRAITKEDIERDIKILKQNNFNAVRTSHYPNNAYFYDLCDRYGLYVIDETNLETHGTWMAMGKVKNDGYFLPGDAPEWRKAVMDRANSMYQRDKNHACILMWSCGNESFGGSILYEMSQWFRSKDTSRLVHYEGVSMDPRFPQTSDVKSSMYAKPDEIEEYLKTNPEKPYISCEYAHAMGNSFGGVQFYIRLEDLYPQYQGGFIWDYIDQALSIQDSTHGRKWLVGGDWFDRPTDGRFCANGLLFADRTPTPKLEEAKYLYSPVRITCTSKHICIENRNLFISTKQYIFAWSLMCNGVEKQVGTFEVDVPSGEQCLIDLPANTELCELSDGEWVFECRVLLKDNTPWASKGHEITFGQTILKNWTVLNVSTCEPARMIIGDCNTGAKMQKSFGLISHLTGQLSSFETLGKELLHRGIALEFWRAPTENDLGNGSVLRWAQWKLASLYQYCSNIQYDKQTGQVISKITLPMQPMRECTVKYMFYWNDTVKVTISMENVDGDLPCFGITLQMPKQYNCLYWYGNVEKESYADRRNACRLGIGVSSVDQQYVPYLKPQECGNKTCLRELCVTDKNGRGLAFWAPQPFEASVLPYTAHEIENAAHAMELPSISRTVIRVLKGQCGVGGDDSWGAPVHSEFLFPKKHNLNFTFYIKILDGRNQEPTNFLGLGAINQ